MAEARWPRRLYALALRTWPRDVRDRSGDDALSVFEERLAGAGSAHARRAAFVAAEVAGALVAGIGFRRDARRAAHAHGTRKAGLMDALMQDVRFAVRSLGRNPVFAFLVVLVLALGIGANTAIFSVVNATLLRPLPAPQPDRLVTIRESNPEFDWVAQVAAPANMFDWRERVSAFADVAGHAGAGEVTLTGMGDPELIRDVDVTGNFFDVLGVRAALGRTLREAETWNTEPRVIVLSDGFWTRRFGRAPDVIGRTITLNGLNYEIVGVMPPGFTFPADAIDVWRPMRWNPDDRTAVYFRRAHWVETIARLAPGATLESAEAELQTVVRQLAGEYPATNRVMGAHVYPLHSFLVGDVRTPLLLLMGAVLLLLLVACANAGNLVLVRAAGRQRELAVRAALGAGRARIARLVLTESLLLSVAGGALGVLVAVASMRALAGLLPPTLPRAAVTALDLRVLGFAFAITLLAGLAFGAVPALRAAGTRLSHTLREGGRGSSAGQRTLRTAHGLVVGEIAVALVLVLGAGLLVRSFAALRQVHPGFDVEDRFTARVTLPGIRYDTLPDVLTFYDRLLERVRATAGVTNAGMSSVLPLFTTDYTSSFIVEGWPPERFGAEVMHRRVTDGWFETMNVTLLDGRFLDARDRTDTQPVVVINETLRRQFFAGEDPIGRRIAFDRVVGPNTQWSRIVGVVADIHQESPSKDPRIEVFHPVSQDATASMAIVVHGQLPPADLARVVRTAVAELDPDIPLAQVQTYEEIYAASMRQDRFMLTLLGGFAALALTLAALGVYGVAAQAARRRTQEIGIRVALGARRGDVARLILGQALRLAGAGVVLGVLGGLAATRLMSSVLFGIVPTDPATFVVVPLLLAGVAMLASWLPARGATRVDPLTALRAD